MKKKKSNLVLPTVILAVITALTGMVYLITAQFAGETEPTVETKSNVFSIATSEYSGKITVKSKENEIYMPSGVGNLYYTLSLDNSCAFYSYANNTFSPLEKTGTVTTKLSASYETIPVTIDYIVKDGKTFGCGVYTADMQGSSDVYDFAFAKVIDKPSGYGTGYLLVSSFDKDEFYKANKTYSELYSFDLSSGSATTYVSNNTRLIDKNGTFRQDWTMLTDFTLNNLGNGKYFLSSRYYSQEETGKRTDVMTLSNAMKPTINAKDILGMWFVNDSEGMHYIKSSDTGFDVILYSNDKEEVKKSFVGDYFEDFIQSENYIIDKISLKLTNLLTLEEKQLKGIDLSLASDFSISPSGNRAVFTFNGNENNNGVPVQTVIYYNIDSGDADTFTEPLLFIECASFCFLDDNTVSSVRALDTAGEKTATVTYTFQ